jgi:hypothetical protein
MQEIQNLQRSPFSTGRLIVPAGSGCEPQNIEKNIEFRSAGLGRFELSLTAQGIHAGRLKRHRLSIENGFLLQQVVGEGAGMDHFRHHHSPERETGV